GRQASSLRRAQEPQVLRCVCFGARVTIVGDFARKLEIARPQPGVDALTGAHAGAGLDAHARERIPRAGTVAILRATHRVRRNHRATRREDAEGPPVLGHPSDLSLGSRGLVVVSERVAYRLRLLGIDLEAAHFGMDADGGVAATQRSDGRRAARATTTLDSN